jgi:hypothetical protein
MKSATVFLRTLGVFTLIAGPLAAQHWQTQFFYDKGKSQFVINDLKFPSASRGVAVGLIVGQKRQDPMSYVTADGGAHWNSIALKEPPVSLFFLNENLGWLVTTKGLWKTDEAGKSWQKLQAVRGHSQFLRVYFVDEKNGWAVGPKKTVMETHDGGERWVPLSVATNTPGLPEYSAYTWVSFATPAFGLITGWNIPPRSTLLRRPEWVDPEAAVRIRETPHLSYTLATSDGGKTWKPNSASLFGVISRLCLRPNGSGLGLLEYGQSFRYPSEAFAIDWTAGTNQSAYRNEKFDISDVWLAGDGTAYLAGNLVTGQLRHVVPGKVQVLISHDLKNWEPMRVDYRAEANRTLLAAPDDQNVWLATDTGMILKLTK